MPAVLRHRRPVSGWFEQRLRLLADTETRAAPAPVGGAARTPER
jgi:hypothetical protein